MASPELNAEVLLSLGFVDVGRWQRLAGQPASPGR